MKLADWRPGWRTEAILHRWDGVIVERDDCLVIRSPSNPTYYWGNCLMLERLPADGDLAHWRARFDEEITRLQPASRHVAIGVDGEDHGVRLPAWEADGFSFIVHRMLQLRPGGERAPARAPRGDVRFRPLDLARPDDLESLLDVEVTDAAPFEPAGYRRFLVDQHRRHAAMQAAGRLRWFGLWCDGTLAATCGLMRDADAPGREGRFQRVVTHADFRRRGLCSTLVHRVLQQGFADWRCESLFMAADPADVAIGIYRSLGFGDLSTGIGLQRYAPRDGAS